jgi:hypothetical protein
VTCAVFALRAHFVVAVMPCDGDVLVESFLWGKTPVCTGHRAGLETRRLYGLQSPRTVKYVQRLLVEFFGSEVAS